MRTAWIQAAATLLPRAFANVSTLRRIGFVPACSYRLMCGGQEG
jgi:hypothetical protein